MSELTPEVEECCILMREIINHLDTDNAISLLCMTLGTTITQRYPVQEWAQRAHDSACKVKLAINRIPTIQREEGRYHS